MNRKTLVPLAATALIGVVAAGGGAFAGGSGKDAARDAALVAKAKVSLSQAITAAEQSTGGKAFDAEVDSENGKLRYSVKVADAQGVKSVLVDPETAQVTAEPADDDDADHSG